MERRTRRLDAGLLSCAAATLLACVATPWVSHWVAVALATATLCLVIVAQRSVGQQRQHDLERLAQLSERITRREGDVRFQAERMRQIDLIDRSSGLLNRRGFTRRLRDALDQCQRHGAPLMMLLIARRADPIGSSTSAPSTGLVAERVRRAVRASDAIGRWDEFALVAALPGCAQADPVLERIRQGLPEAGLTAWTITLTNLTPGEPWPDAEGLITRALATWESTPEASEADEPVARSNRLIRSNI